VATTLDPAWWLIAHRHYSSEDIRAFARGSNFEVQVIGVTGGWWDMLSLWNLYVSKWIFRRNPILQRRLDKNLDREHTKGYGFMTIFSRMVAR
jgi:hypothetical protein